MSSPSGAIAVSECSTSTSSTAMPSLSATIIDQLVSWPCPCGVDAGDDLHLAGRQHPHRRRLPAAGAVVERREHAGSARARTSRRSVEMPMPRCLRRPGRAALPPARARSVVVADHLERAVECGLVVAASRTASPAAVAYGNWSGGMKLRRRISAGSTPTSRASASIGPLDGVRRLGPARAAVRVGRRPVREHAGARERVARARRRRRGRGTRRAAGCRA